MSDAAVAERNPSAETFTCDRCQVTVQWMAGHEPNRKKPAHWSSRGGVLHCLACRRDRAAEAGLEDVPEGAPIADKVKAQSAARVEFEVKRDPEKANGEIAKAAGASVAAVQKARERLKL